MAACLKRLIHSTEPVRCLILALIMMTSLAQTGHSQTNYLRGRICDSLSLAPMPGVVVELNDRDGSTLHYSTTGEDGSFSFRNIGFGIPMLRCSILGYRSRTIKLNDTDSDIGTILMQEDAIAIEAAMLKDQAFRSSQNGDTLIYNAAAYKTMMGSSSESLISKMPGISVSSQSVEANGKKVTRILVDGQEYFDDDVMTALKNIPADLVSEVEVLDKRSDEAEMAGMDDGNDFTAINIVTKRKGGEGILSGRLYGGYGLTDKYIAGGSLNYLGKERSAALLGMANNISKYNFISDDLVSASSSNGSSVDGNFAVKSLAGISDVQSVGGNYTNRWFNGSYMFNRIDNGNASSSVRRRAVRDGLDQLTSTSSDYEAQNNTHRFASKISISPRGKHSLIVRPSLTYQDIYDTRYQETGLHNILAVSSSAVPDTTFIRNRTNGSDNDRWTINTRLTATYRYKFNKPGRTLSATLGAGYYHYTGLEHSLQHTILNEECGFDNTLASSYSKQYKDRATDKYTLNGGVTYTEPLGKRSRLAFDYRYTHSSSDGDNRTYSFNKKEDAYNTEPDSKQSAISTSLFMTHLAGARYNYKNKKLQVTGSLSYQSVDYRGTSEMPLEYSVRRHFDNIIYNLVGNVFFNRQNTLRVSARSYTTNPSVTMMQGAVNLNNLSNIRAGNPDIIPSYQHNVEARYIHTNKKKGSTFSLSANYTGSPNYLADSLVVDSPDFEVAEGVKLGEGNLFSKPVNLSGYRKLTGKFSFGCPVGFISSNFNVNGSATMSSVPGMINGDKVPVRRNGFSLGTRLDSNISDRIDFTLAYNGQYTLNEYSNSIGVTRNNYFTQHARGSLKWIVWKGLTFTGSVHYLQNRNIDRYYNDKLTYCDIFIGKKLFRNQLGEVSIGVNDLFDASRRNYHHSISSSGATDSVDSGIGRYFSIQLVYHLRK